MQKVLLITDDAFELSTLAAAMRLHGVNIVGESNSHEHALSIFRTMHPEVVVLDVQFASHGGVPFAHELRKLNPKLGIVLTTACPDLRLLGLKEKEIPFGTLVVLKRSVADLDVICEAIPESITACENREAMIWLNDHSSLHDNAFTSVLHKLTNTQIETLRLVATGLSNSEIGRTRFVSEKAVEQIVARVAQQLNLIPDRRTNLRVLMAGEYFKWIGAPRHPL